MNLKILIHHAAAAAAAGVSNGNVNLSEFASGESQSQFMAAALVLEGVDGAEGVSEGDVESEMGKGEKRNGDP